MYTKKQRLFKSPSCSNLIQKNVPEDIIGQTTITDIKKNKKITVYLYQKKNISNQYENIYELRLLENNQNVLLGAIKFFKIKRINEFQDKQIYSEYHKRKIAYSNKDDDILFFSSTSLYGGKHNKEKVVPKIYVHLLNTHASGYKGIGTVLLQAAIETSFHEQLAGRLSLLAIDSSHIFYYKMHLRAMNSSHECNTRIADQINKQLALLTETQDKEKRRIEGYILVWDGNMCLPDSAIKKWDRIIENDPVLFKTQEIQKKIFYIKNTGIVMGVKSDLDNQLTNKK